MQKLSFVSVLFSSERRFTAKKYGHKSRNCYLCPFFYPEKENLLDNMHGSNVFHVGFPKQAPKTRDGK